METTISNKHKCKECRWFDGCKCLEPERNRINEEKGWNYYRNFRKMPSEPACIRFEEKEDNKCKKCRDCKYLKVGKTNADGTRGEGECIQPYRNRMNVHGRYFSNIACKQFEEKENDMLNEESLKDFQAVLDSTYKTLDAMEGMLDRELEIRGEVKDVDDPKAPKNRYGIGETLYLPVKVTGIRESVNGSTVLYEVKTTDGKRLGFKVFECASDIWRDKDHYMATIPEHLLMENFEEA